MRHRSETTGSSRPSRAGAAATLAGALLALVAVMPGASADAAKVKVLGAAKPAPASCPAQCLVEAGVTGFQTRIGKIKDPFRVPAHGRVVGWSIKLGSPARTDIRYFNRRFGGSRARISVLKPVKIKRGSRKPKVKFRLLRQSPVVKLRPFFGVTTTFGLSRALKVRKGNVIALTIPTWAPSFSVTQGRTVWRSSRAPSDSKGPCTLDGGLANLAAGEAQQSKGSQRRYGCFYRGARLLYTARFIRNSKQ